MVRPGLCRRFAKARARGADIRSVHDPSAALHLQPRSEMPRRALVLLLACMLLLGTSCAARIHGDMGLASEVTGLLGKAEASTAQRRRILSHSGSYHASAGGYGGAYGHTTYGYGR